ncbi:MAG: hydroxymethylglutaryl-CoA synthase [Thermoanaerobaculia bacterium]
MKPRIEVGIAGYGAYVPRLRVRTADISAAWRPPGMTPPAVAEKSVPDHDEDVVPKFVERVAAELGFTEDQISTGLVARRMGNAYAGSSLLGLAAVLDVAEPGDRIFFCSYGSGAGSDAFSFAVTERIEECRRGPAVSEYLDRRRPVSGYGEYLQLRRKIRR